MNHSYDTTPLFQIRILRPLVKPDDQTKFKLAGMIFQLARTKHSKIQKTFYSKFITAILNLSNILERIFVNKINE